MLERAGVGVGVGLGVGEGCEAWGKVERHGGRLRGMGNRVCERLDISDSEVSDVLFGG